MTNIFAIAVPAEKPEYIFCAADSQATSSRDFTKDSKAQKMVQRGNNILMDTGSAAAAQIVYEKLLGKDLPPHAMAEFILQETEDLAKKLEDHHVSSAIFVCGKNNDNLEMYVVELSNERNPDGPITRGIDQVKQPIFCRGSGSRHVIPALTRDYEKGFFIQPKTPLEALTLCFGVGAKADTDMAVNEKLQLGIVSKTSTRLILPPSVTNYSLAESNYYYTNLTGHKFDTNDNLAKQRVDELTTLSRCADNFYLALETEMHRLLSADISSNLAHSKFKIGEVDLDRYLANVKDRQESARRAQVLLDAFMRGGLKEMNDATRQFYKDQEEIFKAAEEVVSRSEPKTKYCEYPTSSQ